MSYEPDADGVSDELTAEHGDTLDDRSFWSNPNNRSRILIGIALSLVVIIVLLLMARNNPPSVEATPTLGDLEARPVSIIISGVSFDLELVTVDGGRWQTGSGGSAEWVFGTLVPYVIGLHPTIETVRLMEDLVEGDSIVLNLSNGTEQYFRVSGRQRVGSDTTGFFRQSRPGIVVALLGEGGAERLVVSGTYDAEQEPLIVGAAGLARVGVPVQSGDWRATVLSGRLIDNVDPDNPSQAFYFVDFTVEYLGTNPISADTFDLTLIDGVGVRYIIDRDVSSRGAYGPPGGLVAPRNPTSFTAGYRVADNIPGPSLTWEFKSDPSDEVSARFEVPIVKPTPTPQPRTQLIIINCCSARLNDDQTLLVLRSGIGNPTDSEVVIDLNDISLRTDDNVVSDLHLAEPPLPWVIGPKQDMEFRLHFTRPPSFTALFQIVNKRFELTGLR